MMKKILLFAGTSEGRKIASILNGKVNVRCQVATEYGKKLLEESLEKQSLAGKTAEVVWGRMDASSMEKLMEEETYDIVLDCTHPYAKEVTRNIKKACTATSTEYVRILRESCDSSIDNIVHVSSAEEAVEYLNDKNGNIFLTTGSKEIEKFAKIDGYKERVYVRILPAPEAVKKCLDAGFSGNRIIAMQGPFTSEMNSAMIKYTKASFVVTKDSGSPGGTEEKITAAAAAGAQTIIIGRSEEEGISFSQALKMLNNRYGLNINEKYPEERLNWFPLFIESKNLTVLIVGGGKIAARRIKTLSRFSFEIKVVAPEVCMEVEELEKEDRVKVDRKKFTREDISQADIIIAATEDNNLNRDICREGRKKAYYVNSASDKEECTFYFPAVITGNDLTIALNCQGKNHRRVRELREFIENVLKNKGEI